MSNGIYPVLPIGAYQANTQAIANAHIQMNNNAVQANNTPVAKNIFVPNQGAAPQPDKLQAALASNQVPVQKVKATDPQIPQQLGNPNDPTGKTGKNLYCLA